MSPLPGTCGISPSSGAAWRWQGTQRVRTGMLSPAALSCQSPSQVRISILVTEEKVLGSKTQAGKAVFLSQILLSQLALNPLGHYLCEVIRPPLQRPSSILSTASAFQYCSFMKLHLPFSCVFEPNVYFVWTCTCRCTVEGAAVANVLHFVPACGSNHCLPQPGLSARWNLCHFLSHFLSYPFTKQCLFSTCPRDESLRSF